MNSTDPEDYAPLSYGAALGIGLMLLLSLPPERDAHRRPSRERRPTPAKLASAPPAPATGPSAAAVVRDA